LRFGTRKEPYKSKGFNINKYQNISSQPQYTKELGHYQTDSVIGKRSDKQAMAILIDINSGMLRIKLYGRSALGFANAIHEGISINKVPLIDLRLDNGKENSLLGSIFPKNKLYNCDTYSS
jgi:IS30 family transposase